MVTTQVFAVDGPRVKCGRRSACPTIFFARPATVGQARRLPGERHQSEHAGPRGPCELTGLKAMTRASAKKSFRLPHFWYLVLFGMLWCEAGCCAAIAWSLTERTRVMGSCSWRWKLHPTSAATGAWQRCGRSSGGGRGLRWRRFLVEASGW